MKTMPKQNLIARDGKSTKVMFILNPGKCVEYSKLWIFNSNLIKNHISSKTKRLFLSSHLKNCLLVNQHVNIIDIAENFKNKAVIPDIFRHFPENFQTFDQTKAKNLM